ncbi:MAG: LysM peptidoglycan-binding domain-containing protein [Sphingobacteriales bacterium]|nr:MAG: LysM peptidoglycan-binding domain-containing protein [Sphingobacteriales bacterium]
MRLVCLLFVAAFFYGNSAFANKDSIGVKNIAGKIFIMHKVTKGEGLMSVGRKYGVKPGDIEKANPSVKSGIQLGQVINIPYMPKPKNAMLVKKTAVKKEPVRFIPAKNESKTKNTNTEPVFYTVAAGETLFGVAKKHAVKTEDIVSWNKLKNNQVNAGQKLIVSYGNRIAEVKIKPDGVPKWEKPVAVNETPKQEKQEANDEKDKLPVRVIPEKTEKKENNGVKTVWKEVKESGVATWIDDANITSETKFALHKTAPVGTVIRLRNPMNKNEVLVKIIGHLPEDAEENVAIKISKSTAEKLGLRDKYFRLDMIYGMEVAQK